MTTESTLGNLRVAHSNLSDVTTSEIVGIEKGPDSSDVPQLGTDLSNGGDDTPYRLYKRRFVGLVSLMLLSAVGGMAWPWFGPIANNVVDEFGFTLDQVNWFSNIVNVTYLPVSILVPMSCSKYGIQRSCQIGAVFLLIAAWIRYAATAPMNENASYALIIVAQFLAGIAQPFFQILPAKFSETWFDLKGRTTATMVASIANPIGGAIAQLISPLVGSTRTSILVLGIISTVVTPLAFLIGDAPPTPPTFAASQVSPKFSTLVNAMRGRGNPAEPTYMTVRERVDFAIIILEFGALTGVVNSFSILTAQFFEPYGYSDTISGLMGATLLLVGIVAAGITAPLYDRVLTHHLGLSCKILCPILAVCWLSLIWAIKPHNTGALFALMAIMGATSLTMLPVALELAVELTRNADGSSAILWFTCNLFGIIFVLVEGALRAPDTANPPQNMRRALIFQGAFICGTTVFVAALQGKQRRREMDELRMKEVTQQDNSERSLT